MHFNICDWKKQVYLQNDSTQFEGTKSQHVDLNIKMIFQWWLEPTMGKCFANAQLNFIQSINLYQTFSKTVRKSCMKFVMLQVLQSLSLVGLSWQMPLLTGASLIDTRSFCKKCWNGFMENRANTLVGSIVLKTS